MNSVGIVIVNILLAMGLVWFFFDAFLRYREDSVREKLFQLRHELFLIAADGKVAFDDDAYCCLRTKINALIQQAHTLTFFRFCLFSWLEHRKPFPESLFIRRWKNALNQLQESTREDLQRMDIQVNLCVIKHLITGYAFPIVFILVLPVTLKLRSMRNATKKKYSRDVQIMSSQISEATEIVHSPA